MKQIQSGTNWLPIKDLNSPRGTRVFIVGVLCKEFQAVGAYELNADLQSKYELERPTIRARHLNTYGMCQRINQTKKKCKLVTSQLVSYIKKNMCFLRVSDKEGHSTFPYSRQ